ncbi:ABC transporter ATP-binding protein [Listeria innocua]|uniref:ABC transporter ATP-binding protein n=1 Tax=Listeria innocua TaxID=1642 RepID=UPI0016258BE0|nr:ABC transporter ATP-binding protein [Listeria innocua]MBC1385548.1 ABC transporter ATP-binding protein [Listeria innocua]
MKETYITLKRIMALAFSLEKKHLILFLIINTLKLYFPIAIMLNTQIIVNKIQKGTSFFSYDFMLAIAIFPVLNIALELFNTLSGYISSRYSDILNFKFSKLQLDHINKQSLESFEDPEFYDLIQRAEQAAGTYPFQISMTFVNVFSMLLSSISYVYILLMWKWWTIILIFIFPLISSIKMIRVSRDEYKTMYNRTHFERKSWYYANLLNKDEYIKETRLFSLEKNFLNKFVELRMTFLDENRKMYKRRSLFTFVISFVSILTTTVILVTVFFEASIGKILIGSLMTYINSISSLKSNFTNIINSFFSLHQQSLYAKNILELLNYKDGLEINLNNENAKIRIEKVDSIEIKNLYFKYNRTEKYALKNISFDFKKGEKYVIVGQNGSGKSTLIKILLGFYHNYEGEILINNIPLKKIDPKSYRNCITAVFQDYARYQFTVEEVVSISDNNDKDSLKIREVTKEVEAEEFINRLPNKFVQQLGSWFPGGVQLSGGEWQKLCIARAFYKSKSSVVALDEPSSALDPISEERIFESYNALTKDKIGLFVTHRMKNIEFDGIILVLNDGEIVESGKQNDLLMKKGLFYKLVNAKKNF